MREMIPGDGSWVKYFLSIAKLISTRSKDMSTKVGAIIVDVDNVQVSTGYNGFVKGINPEGMSREEKIFWTLHAEENAILFSDAIRKKNATLYCTAPCCSKCMRMALQSGITTIIVIAAEAGFAGRWKEDCEQAAKMAEKKGIDYFYVTEENV